MIWNGTEICFDWIDCVRFLNEKICIHLACDASLLRNAIIPQHSEGNRRHTYEYTPYTSICESGSSRTIHFHYLVMGFMSGIKPTLLVSLFHSLFVLVRCGNCRSCILCIRIFSLQFSFFSPRSTLKLVSIVLNRRFNINSLRMAFFSTAFGVN